jgi:DNA-directed RNA polymerase subunit RPC12/RpoP
MPTNLPREHLLLHAQEACRRIPGAVVYFKWTCEACGERVTFDEPNTLYEQGECSECGHRQEVTEGGYLLHVPPREGGRGEG